MQHSNHVIASGLLGPAARQGYTEGAIDFLNVISVQAALLQSQSQLVNVDTEMNKGRRRSTLLLLAPELLCCTRQKLPKLPLVTPNTLNWRHLHTTKRLLIGQ